MGLPEGSCHWHHLRTQDDLLPQRPHSWNHGTSLNSLLFLKQEPPSHPPELGDQSSLFGTWNQVFSWTTGFLAYALSTNVLWLREFGVGALSNRRLESCYHIWERLLDRKHSEFIDLLGPRVEGYQEGDYNSIFWRYYQFFAFSCEIVGISSLQIVRYTRCAARGGGPTTAEPPCQCACAAPGALAEPCLPVW